MEDPCQSWINLPLKNGFSLFSLYKYVYLFQDNNWSKSQWIFIELDICAFILWRFGFGLLMCKFRQFFYNLPATCITKTHLYNFDPLKPHFYIVKLGFTGVYIIFLFLLKNIDCGYSLEPPRVTSTHNLCFEQKYEKYQIFLSENFQFFEVKFSI